MSGTVVISGQITQTPVGTVNIGPFTIAPSTTNEIFTQIGPFGANTLVTVPDANLMVCIIQPPADNTQTIKLKKLSGETGILISETNPTLLALDPGTDSFYLDCGGLIALQITFY